MVLTTYWSLCGMQLPPRPSVIKRQPPVSREEWESFRDQSGRISAANQDQFLARVFYGVSNSFMTSSTVFNLLILYCLVYNCLLM